MKNKRNLTRLIVYHYVEKDLSADIRRASSWVLLGGGSLLCSLQKLTHSLLLSQGFFYPQFHESLSAQRNRIRTRSHLLHMQDPPNFWKAFQTHCISYCIFITQSGLTVCDSIAHQTPLSMGFSRQEYWSGLPFPSLI